MLEAMQEQLAGKVGNAGNNAFKLRKLFKMWDTDGTGKVPPPPPPPSCFLPSPTHPSAMQKDKLKHNSSAHAACTCTRAFKNLLWYHKGICTNDPRLLFLSWVTMLLADVQVNLFCQSICANVQNCLHVCILLWQLQFRRGAQSHGMWHR